MLTIKLTELRVIRDMFNELSDDLCKLYIRQEELEEYIQKPRIYSDPDLLEIAKEYSDLLIEITAKQTFFNLVESYLIKKYVKIETKETEI